jgi:hypothetical protein
MTPARPTLASAFLLVLALATPSCGGDEESLGTLDDAAGGQGGASAGSGGAGGGSSGNTAAGSTAAGTGGSSGSTGAGSGGAGSGGAGAGGAGSAGAASGQAGAAGAAAGAGATGASAGDAGAGGVAGEAGAAPQGGSSGNQTAGGAGGQAGGAGGQAGGQAGGAGGQAGGQAGGAGEQAGGAAGALGEFCAGKGSTIPLPGGKCSGDLSKKTFLFALCSCSSVKANNSIVTDSLDSSTGQSTGKNGSVGVRGDYDGQQATIGGSLWVDGSVTMGNHHDVAVELQCGGPLDTNASEVAIAADAYVEGDIADAQGKLVVGKTLFIPAGKAHPGVVATSVVEGPVDVAAPCDCDAPIDIVGLVQSFAQGNDDEANGVSPGELTGLTAAVTRELPCGRYYFTGVQSTSSVTVKLTGHTAIFIEGDVLASGPLAFELGPDAELDLFISGSLKPDNAVKIGDKARPAATRVYVAGEVLMSGQLDLAANLYLPNAIFSGKNTVELWGALYAKGLSLDGALTVHYDEAILEVPGCAGSGGSAGGQGVGGQAGSGQAGSGQAGSGQAGGQSGQGGSGCSDCKGCDNPTPACSGGTCGPCTKNSDCCPPMVCNVGNGLCVVPGGKP